MEMKDVEEYSIEDDSDSKDGDDKKPRPIIRTAVDLQRLKLEKLMKHPEKPVIIPEQPKEKDFLQSVPSFVRNVMGSSAGAGSGEFHVYRHLRRKEYARMKYIQSKSLREQMDDEFQAKLEKNKLDAEAKTAKKRAKRQKKKQRAKQKGKKSKVDNQIASAESVDDASSAESSEDEEQVEDSKKDEQEVSGQSEADEDKNRDQNEVDTVPNKEGAEENVESNAKESSNTGDEEHLTEDNANTSNEEKVENVIVIEKSEENGCNDTEISVKSD